MLSKLLKKSEIFLAVYNSDTKFSIFTIQHCIDVFLLQFYTVLHSSKTGHAHAFPDGMTPWVVSHVKNRHCMNLICNVPKVWFCCSFENVGVFKQF